MLAGKTRMAMRVPVLRQDHVICPLDEPVHLRDDGITIGDSQRPAGAEIILDIDDDQGVL